MSHQHSVQAHLGVPAIATLSLHHIPTLAAKRAVYENICEALTSPGIFLNGDCTIDATEAAHGLMERYWLDSMSMHGISEEEGRKHLDAWSKADTYQQIYDELAHSRKPAFNGPRCFGSKVHLRCMELSRPLIE